VATNLVGGAVRSDDTIQSTMLPVGQADISPQDGNVHIADPIDFRQSVPT